MVHLPPNPSSSKQCAPQPALRQKPRYASEINSWYPFSVGDQFIQKSQIRFLKSKKFKILKKLFEKANLIEHAAFRVGIFACRSSSETTMVIKDKQLLALTRGLLIAFPTWPDWFGNRSTILLKPASQSIAEAPNESSTQVPPASITYESEPEPLVPAIEPRAVRNKPLANQSAFRDPATDSTHRQSLHSRLNVNGDRVFDVIEPSGLKRSFFGIMKKLKFSSKESATPAHGGPIASVAPCIHTDLMISDDGTEQWHQSIGHEISGQPVEFQSLRPGQILLH